MSAGLSTERVPLLRMTGIHKRFPGVQALKGVAFETLPGEVHALVGENGAGKSTLMHILAGVYQPDAGEIRIDDKPVVFGNELSAQKHGVAIVFQERSLFEQLSVADNIFAARQPVRFGRVCTGELYANTRRLLGQVGLEQVHPGTILSELSPAEQQMVEVAKALSLEARLIIFDEPTAALTETETRALFAVIRKLQNEAKGIIYISHRLEEIFEIAQRVTILKDGEGQGTLKTSEATENDLVRRMVGRELAGQQFLAAAGQARSPMLAVRNLAEDPWKRGQRICLKGISFTAEAGEIVAFAGLAGAGRTEVALSIFGARKWDAGEIHLNGQAVRIGAPEEAINLGIGYLPEDRKEAGLFLEMSIADNLGAAHLKHFGNWWFQNRSLARVTEDYISKLRVSCRSIGQPVQTLSGGNQQKVILARWLLVQPRVLIVDEPTRGVDVGAKAEVHALLRQLAASGTAVIVISSDLPEVLALGDRILVMSEGRITGELSSDEATEEAILKLASQHLPQQPLEVLTE